MNRPQAFLLARATGHIAWWVFVAATLFGGGLTWVSGDSGQSFYNLANSGSDCWFLSVEDSWTGLEIVGLVAFIVVIVSAITEALIVGRLGSGVLTVVLPLVAFTLLVIATPGVFSSVHLNLWSTFGLVLLAVAIREIWARRFAPRPNAGSA